MEYRYLGKSGLYASRISLGGVLFGKEGFLQSRVDRVIGVMFDSGINLIDTAYIYGGGESEVLIGKALGEKRKDVILVTKGGHYKAKYDPPSVGAPSRRYLVREVETCLKRLNTDYIDVYMWHMGDSVPPHEMLRAMDDLVRSGKVLYIGGSNTPAWKLGVASEVRTESRPESDRARTKRIFDAQPELRVGQDPMLPGVWDQFHALQGSAEWFSCRQIQEKRTDTAGH